MLFMTQKTTQTPPQDDFMQEPPLGVPFRDFNDLWFWFIQAQAAKEDGARFRSGLSETVRPCEPADILKIMDRFYRNRLLLWEHFLVLRHYGRRQCAPDRYRIKEARAAKLWDEAKERLEPVFIRKGLIQEKVVSIFHTMEQEFEAYDC